MVSLASRLPRSAFQVLIAASVATASVPGLAAPELGFEDRGSSSGVSGSLKLFRFDDQGLKPLPDLMRLMASVPQAPVAAVVPMGVELPEADPEPAAASDTRSDVTVSQLGPMADGSLIALQDLGSSASLIAQRPVPPRPSRPPAPVTPTPAPAPAPAPVPPLINSAFWTVVVVAGVAVAVLVATGPTPPVSR